MSLLQNTILRVKEFCTFCAVAEPFNSPASEHKKVSIYPANRGKEPLAPWKSTMVCLLLYET